MSEGLQIVQADGNEVALVGEWALEKYRLLWYYAKIFSTGMKNQWPRRLYLDLYAGPGYARVRGADSIYKNAALLALSVPDPFTKYILCEKVSKWHKALDQRVRRDYTGANVHLIKGDCNENVEQILQEIRRTTSIGKHLAFCFLDPYSMKLSFSTIASLERSCPRMDFLILLALGMDAQRNEVLYTDPSYTRIDELLDDREWRDRWVEERSRGVTFSLFVAREFVTKMSEIGYPRPPESLWKGIRPGAARRFIYHLIFFSKDKKGYKFWRETLKYAETEKQLRFDS